jgi:hypothetical protein
MKNFFRWLRIIILILSVYFAWSVIIEKPNSDAIALAPIPFVILTIYVWKELIKKND